MTTSLELLREAIQRHNFVVLDTETTGLKVGEICEIAIVSHTGDVLANHLVRPKNGIPWDAERIHGISNEMVEDAPTFDLIVPEIQTLVEGKDVLVYNAIYDRKMLHQSAEAINHPKVEWKSFSNWLCVMEAYAEFYGDWNDYKGSFTWQKLTAAVRQQDIQIGNAHRALGDCLMTLALIQVMSGGKTA